ncbi:MAG TPA: hypothetical protein VFN79_01405 [Steroidobacteraceae bacterium]|nr:hypothetical protein [Steroidobacteraceae bacterium]
MSRDLNGIADFERQLHALLEESVQRVGGPVRSRLNQARHTALAEAEWPGRWQLGLRLAAWLRRPLLWLPAAGGVAAALLVAFVLWPHAPRAYPAAEASRAAAEDLDLLADRDGMELMQNGDGQFYEWAVAQASVGGPPADSGGSARAKGQGRGGEAGTDRSSG